MIPADDVRAITALFATISEQVLEKGSRTEQGAGSHSKLIGSPHPGNTPAANWVGDVAAFARTAEADLREACHFTAIERGGSDANTIKALWRIPILVAAYESKWPSCPRDALATPEKPIRHGLACGPHGYLPHIVVAILARLTAAGHVLVGDEEPWTPVPTSPGFTSTCPHCHRPSLRWREKTREVRCVADDCANPYHLAPDDLEQMAVDVALETTP